MRRRKVPANALVAKVMNSFFDALSPEARSSPSLTARAYARHMYDSEKDRLIDEWRFKRARFHVGIGLDSSYFNDVTKRAAVVSDCLLLSHNGSGQRHFAGRLPVAYERHLAPPPDDQQTFPWIKTDIERDLHFSCPKIEALGQWLIDAEPLLRLGSLWYLPSFSLNRTKATTPTMSSTRVYTSKETVNNVHVRGLLDFTKLGQRVVAVDRERYSGASITSK